MDDEGNMDNLKTKTFNPESSYKPWVDSLSTSRILQTPDTQIPCSVIEAALKGATNLQNIVGVQIPGVFGVVQYAMRLERSQNISGSSLYEDLSSWGLHRR